MAEFKRTQRDYPLSFKISVVEQVEKGELTSSPDTIRGRCQRNTKEPGYGIIFTH